MRRLGWLVPAMLVLGLGGCATAAPPGAPPPSGSATVPSVSATVPSVSAPVAGCPATLLLNNADNGKTACVTRGGAVVVSLAGSPGQDWAPLQVSPSQVLTTVPTSVSGPPDLTYGSYTAAAAGTVEITSSRSACAPPSPGSVACHALQSFRVTVTVR